MRRYDLHTGDCSLICFHSLCLSPHIYASLCISYTHRGGKRCTHSFTYHCSSFVTYLPSNSSDPHFCLRSISLLVRVVVTKQSIRSGLADANRVIGSSAPDAEKAEARVEVEVYEALQAALAK